ncbi:hypothetical protein EV175_004484, partial [Coemansia sp. RSA 1933]
MTTSVINSDMVRAAIEQMSAILGGLQTQLDSTADSTMGSAGTTKKTVDMHVYMAKCYEFEQLKAQYVAKCKDYDQLSSRYKRSEASNT